MSGNMIGECGENGADFRLKVVTLDCRGQLFVSFARPAFLRFAGGGVGGRLHAQGKSP